MKFRSLILALGIFLSFTLSAFAADPIVDEIVFINDIGEELSIEYDKIQSQVGEVLDTDKLINDVNTLKDTLPQYQNIVTAINPINESEESVQIIFEFQMKRTIQSIRLITDGSVDIPLDLREKLRSQRHGEFDSGNLEKDKQTIQDHFIANGYPETKVEHEIMLSSNGDDVGLTFMIRPNSGKLIVTSLNFNGNASFKRSKLKDLFKSKPRGFFLSRHTDFSLFQLQDDVSELTRFYKENGFFDVKIDFDYRFDFDGSTDIDIFIEEGKRYLVKSFEINHSDRYSAQEINDVYDFDKVHYYNDKDLRNILQNLREFFGKKGHAKVQVLASYDSVNETIQIRIIEGPIFNVRNIIVEGNERIDTRKILYDVDIEAGDQFDAEKVKKTMQKMRETGFYSDVRVDFEPTSQDTGNVVVIVKEARTRTISFGAGTGTNGIMGELSFSDRNFLNSGKSISLHLRRTLEMTKIGLVYRDPHLFESDYAMKLSTSYKDDSRYDFDEKRIGAVLMIEKRITENLKLGVGTRIEFLNLSDIDEEIRLADHNADGEDRIIGMVGTLFYKTQTKDAAGDIKDGIKINMALLPSYADQGAYVKAFSTIMATKSIWENDLGVAHTVSGRLTVGYASENAPFHEKFYAGGAGTLRGFKRKSVKTAEGDGGQVLISASVGYSFPIWEDTVKGVVFLEAASVGDRLEDLGEIRAVGGFGVKANLMDTFLGSMIEAGVAIPLRKEEGDELRPFYFIFGDYDPAYDL